MWRRGLHAWGKLRLDDRPKMRSGGKVGGAAPERKDAEAVRLFRQYLLGSLETHAVFSVKTLSDGDGPRTLWFQVLTLEAKGLFRSTCRSGTDQDLDLKEEDGLYFASVQPFCRWSDPSEEDADGHPTEAECFVYNDPSTSSPCAARPTKPGDLGWLGAAGGRTSMDASPCTRPESCALAGN